MKKILILALGLFVTGLTANAQSTDSFIRLGIKGGANFSNIIKDDGNNDFKTNYLTGFNAGLTLDIKLLENLAFTPELLYSTKGYKTETVFGNFTQTTHFIDVPILASIKLAEGFNVVAGPQVSFLMSTNNKFENGFGTAQQQIVEDESDRFKKAIVAGVIGARFDFNNKVGIFGRYALDFQKTNENGDRVTPEFKNQVFQVGLGLKF
ncbi:porin family protein [Pedobacter xixiisoli]|uniref:Outer membrane protein beta-barrel domain-containing protein n=1 Tax=Pedobacter xixiisoli TaxID=1476464 RepID=A0A286ACX8_9SPHI|nr:porin family protein [Pedobacter xixiisoli]SOD19752.1 Outer membrane protein beta-barrel domain-containing protein [Pedobacter xixiisoli]